MTCKAEFEASLLRQIASLEKYLEGVLLLPTLQAGMPTNLAAMTHKMVEHQMHQLELAKRTLERIRNCAADDTEACYQVMMGWFAGSPPLSQAKAAS